MKTSQDTTVYSVALPNASFYVRNIICTANNSAGVMTHTFAVYKFGPTVIKSGRFVVKNATCPPNAKDKGNIYNMVYESLGASCLKDLNITFECGSLIVHLTLTMTADIPDPFISLREVLIQNAAKYGFTIDPSSVKMNEEGTTAPPTSAPVTQATTVPSGGLTDVTIALIVVGCVVFLLIMFGVVFLVCKKKRKRRDTSLEMDSHGARDNIALNESPVPYAENMAMEETHSSSPENTSQRATTADEMYEPVGDASQYLTAANTRQRVSTATVVYEPVGDASQHPTATNTSQRASTAAVVYEPVGDASQHPTADTIPQYEQPSDLLSPGKPSRDPVSNNNRSEIPEYEDVSGIDGRNVTIATNNTGRRIGTQANTSTQDPSYINTRQRWPESQIYQPLQTAEFSPDDAQYGSLNSATRYGAESGLSSTGSEAAHDYENTGTFGGAGVYQRLGRRTVDPVYQSTGNTTSA